MATIIIKNSTGSGVVPSSLVQGELAINTKDGKLYYGSGSGNVVKEFTGSGGGGTTFPYTGSAVITGSLTITGSFFVSNNINSSTRELYDSLGSSSIDWENRNLFDNTNQTSIDWQQRLSSDSSGNASVNWETRRLTTPNGTRAFEYGYTDYASRSNVYHQQNVTVNEQELLSNTNLEYSGQTIEASIDGVTNVGDLIYLETDGIWYAVSQPTSTSTKLLGINIDGTNVLLEGDIILNSINLPDHGLPLYIRQGNGRTLSSTIPTSGYVRVVGHCYYQNGTTSANWVVKFRPSNDWYEI